MDRRWRVSRSVFQVVERAGGWGLLDNGKPVLWFPERHKALAIAKQMTDARRAFHGLPDYVHARGDDGAMELVAAFE